jgi:hypothetical protein
MKKQVANSLTVGDLRKQLDKFPESMVIWAQTKDDVFQVPNYGGVKATDVYGEGEVAMFDDGH